MALVSQSIKNLKGGISQQPDILRFPDQGEIQINGWSSETEGLQKRPPAVFIKSLAASGEFGPAPLVHMINRDQYEQYYVVFTGSGVRVFELDGTEKQVRGLNSYVNVAWPRSDLRMVTVADYTFIVNREVTVQESNDVNLPGFVDNRTGIINIRGGQYGRRLQIFINGGLRADYLLPDGTDPKHSVDMDAQKIASELHQQMTGAKVVDGVSPLPAGWKVSVGEGYIYVEAPSDDSIRDPKAFDGYAGQLINWVGHYVSTFTKLPVHCPGGYIVKITGDTSKSSDAYYVEYDEARKVWKETLGWNVQKHVNAGTMPHTLIRAADGNFDFKAAEWTPRKVGDDDTNPMPSMVGQRISDIFFYRNRLGFLCGENVVMSRTAKYFDFFPASVANLSDDDPIDVAVSHNRISVLKYAVPFSEELLLWSDQAQFVLSAQGTLTAKSVDLSLTTEFDVGDHARPFGLGRSVFFSSRRATYSSLYRYYAVQDVSSVKSAEDMSIHVPSLVPNGVFSIKGSGTENFVSVLSEGAPSILFVYKYLYQDEQPVQKSWSYWDFGQGVTVLAADSIGSTMYVMLQSQSHIWMTTLKFTKHTLDFVEEPYRLYLDNKQKLTVPDDAFNPDTYLTSINITDHYGINLWYGDLYLVGADGRAWKFEQPEDGWGGHFMATIKGNVAGQTMFVGFSIPFTYRFSRFLIKKQAEDGSVTTEDTGRLQLRRAWVNYEQAGAFVVHVDNAGRHFQYTMAGARIGSNGLKLGEPNVGTGQFRFPVNGNAQLNVVTITSDHPTPLNIIGCGWEGNYMRRTSGI